MSCDAQAIITQDQDRLRIGGLVGPVERIGFERESGVPQGEAEQHTENVPARLVGSLRDGKHYL
jgi:hypothetical protein